MTLLDDPGHREVEGVGRLARLEEDVGVLGACRARPEHRASARGRGAASTSSSRTSARRSSSSSTRDLVDLVRGAEAVEEVQERDPRRAASPHGRRARSRAPPGPSLRASIAQPVVRACITSLWSPKIDSAWVATVRAATWITAGVSSPAILNMFGTISSRPWRRGERRRRARPSERAVQRAGRASLGLHLDDVRHRAPQVRAAAPPTSRRSARPSATPG